MCWLPVLQTRLTPSLLQAVQTSPFSSMFQSATFHMPEVRMCACAALLCRVRLSC